MIAATINTVLQFADGSLIHSQVLAVIRPKDNIKFVAQRIVENLIRGAVVVEAWVSEFNYD